MSNITTTISKSVPVYLITSDFNGGHVLKKHAAGKSKLIGSASQQENGDWFIEFVLVDKFAIEVNEEDAINSLWENRAIAEPHHQYCSCEECIPGDFE